MSSAQITGPAVIGNARKLQGKTLLFDAELYVNRNKNIFAAIRYFNSDDKEFGDIGAYVLHATVVKTPAGGVSLRDDDGKVKEFLSDEDYDLVGDAHFLYKVDTDEVAHQPWLTVLGPARNIVPAESTFDINSNQYTPLTKDHKNDSFLPIRAIIDSPKFKNMKNKPIPRGPSTVATSGFVTRIIPKEEEDDDKPERFCLSVDSVTFLGTSGGSALPEPNVDIQKGKRKSLFGSLKGKENNGSGTGPTKRRKPNTPEPSQDVTMKGPTLQMKAKGNKKEKGKERETVFELPGLPSDSELSDLSPGLSSPVKIKQEPGTEPGPSLRPRHK